MVLPFGAPSPAQPPLPFHRKTDKNSECVDLACDGDGGGAVPDFLKAGRGHLVEGVEAVGDRGKEGGHHPCCRGREAGPGGSSPLLLWPEVQGTRRGFQGRAESFIQMMSKTSRVWVSLTTPPKR